ncbi:MAG: UPF0307 protein YjgA [Burkholderiaceae bacterium]|nr:MAG: UPF0307 protein YjgA [Burkholderiaceae bacterium]
MSRKPTKGYFVRGQFVAEGSELDLQLKRERLGDDATSRTAKKRESTELQRLGEELLDLRAELRARLALPEALQDALREADRITDFEGRRRQMQYIGKLMRRLPLGLPDAIRALLQEQRRGSAQDTLALHRAEQWRDALLTGDAALARWLAEHSQTDAQQLRALIRQARRDAIAEPAARHAGVVPRHGRAYRELFRLLMEQLGAQTSPDSTTDQDAAPTAQRQ